MGSFWHLLIDQIQHATVFEWIGFISTFLCIYLAAKENIWNWPISIASIVISAVVYFNSKLYGDFYLQLYFLITGIYGWYFWSKKKIEHDKPIVSISMSQWGMAIVSIVALTLLLGYLLDRFTDSTVPYEDGFCTAMSFVAQIMLTRKIIENWILWIIVDICYVPLLLYKELNLYAILYAVLIFLAIKGYLDWRKTYRAQTN